MKQDAFQKLSEKTGYVNSFAIAVLRDALLENLLQEDASNILYWAGKDLAQQFFTKTLSGIETFFINSGWGTLEMVKQTEREQIWQLRGETVIDRFIANENPDFSLEAGYLAKQLENQLESIAEATFKTNGKDAVLFTVITDPDTPVTKVSEKAIDFREAVLNGEEIQQPTRPVQAIDDVPNFITEEQDDSQNQRVNYEQTFNSPTPKVHPPKNDSPFE